MVSNLSRFSNQNTFIEIEMNADISTTIVSSSFSDEDYNIVVVKTLVLILIPMSSALVGIKAS